MNIFLFALDPIGAFLFDALRKEHRVLYGIENLGEADVIFLDERHIHEVENDPSLKAKTVVWIDPPASASEAQTLQLMWILQRGFLFVAFENPIIVCENALAALANQQHRAEVKVIPHDGGWT